MHLNIKSDEAYELAKELGDLTGQSMTTVVKEALREKLSRVKEQAKPDLSERLMEIGRLFTEELAGQTLMSTDDLYDEMGLPK